MTDLPDSDLDELASAVLDGEPVDDPRATSAEVAARVAELRTVRELLRDVTPPAAVVRDRAIAAAMRAWDEPAVVAPPRPARAVRSASRWWIGVAAAACVAAVAGVVVSGGIGSDDDDSADTINEAAVMEATEATEAASDVTAADLSEESASDDMTLAAPAETDAAGGAATSGEAGTTAAGADQRALDELVGPDDVVEFALARRSAEEFADAMAEPCAAAAPGTPVGPARWARDATSGSTDVLVVRDDDAAVARVLDAATCDVLAEVPLG